MVDIGGNEGYTAVEPSTKNAIKDNVAPKHSKGLKALFASSIAAFATSLGVAGHAAAGNEIQDFPKDTATTVENVSKDFGQGVANAAERTKNTWVNGTPDPRDPRNR